MPRVTSAIRKQQSRPEPRRRGAGGHTELLSGVGDRIKAFAESIADQLGLDDDARRQLELNAASQVVAISALGGVTAAAAAAGGGMEDGMPFGATTPATGEGGAEARKRARLVADDGSGSSSTHPAGPAAVPVLPPRSSTATDGRQLLQQARRGEKFEVTMQGRYGAGNVYDWSDVVSVCERIEAGKLMLRELDDRDEAGNLVHKVPRSTITRWMEDDALIMGRSGKTGVEGRAHWRVELEDRNRTFLKKAGVQSLLGDEVEDALMVKFAEAGKKGWQ